MKKLSVKKIEPLLIEERGNMAAVARRCGVARQSLYEYISKRPQLVKATTEAKESVLDAAEKQLFTEALNGNTACLIFLLKTLGKSRGYVERQELDHSGSIQYEDGAYERLAGKLARYVTAERSRNGSSQSANGA